MPHWLVWKWQRSARKWTKPPFRCDDPTRHAANNDPATWSTRRAAVAAVLAGKANGVGFALTGTEIGAIDLDDCRDPETGAVDAWAKEILDAAPTAYHEVTVSGAGLRIIGIAKGSAQHRKFTISGGRPDAAVEVYRQVRPGTSPSRVLKSASAPSCRTSTRSSTTSSRVMARTATRQWL